MNTYSEVSKSVSTTGYARPRAVLVVSEQAGRDIPDDVLDGEMFDVVHIESTAHAYSHVKKVHPDLVIMCMAPDDVEACRVLSMLKLDRETSDIPVATHLVIAADDEQRQVQPSAACASAARPF